MNYLSVCSGVEAATVAWHHMGWNPVGFSEIEKFPSQVLAHHYPTVTNFGDMTKYKEWNINEPVNILVGGTPCQSFSVAGLRKGLKDPRGNLALTYVGILDKFRPQWCVWENVPGVLSSGGGRDFGSFLGALAELGYGWAYRVLDAQNFGVAQRRRRVFVVGYLGEWKPAAQVLFESESLRRDIKKGRSEGQDPAAFTASGFANYSEGVGTIRAAGGDLGGGSETLYVPDTARCLTRGVAQKNDYETDTFVTKVYENHASDSRVKEVSVCPTVTAKWGTGGGNVPLAMQGNLIGRDAGGPNGIGVSDSNTMYTLTKTDVHAVAYGFTQCDAARDVGSNISPTLRSGGDGGYPNHSVAFAQNQLGELRECDVFNTLNTNSNASGRNTALLRQAMAVRRLTPVECERLQGFPDNYTNIPKAADGNRYKALGNSMAVPVMRWIGERIQMVNSKC